MPVTRYRTPYKLSQGCTQCGEKDPTQFYATSVWCKRCHKEATHQSRLRKLGMTPEDEARLLDAQAGCCAVCKRDGKLFGRAFHMDHDHATGRARGLLCGRCNQVLGRCEDDAGLLLVLASYVTNQ